MNRVQASGRTVVILQYRFQPRTSQGLGQHVCRTDQFGHSVKHLGDGLYVFRWWVYRNIFLVTDEGVIVTDPMNPKAAKLLQSEIRKVTDKPVKYVVYSHNHHDHISRGTIFKEESAKFVGHKNILKELGDHPSPVTPLPDITFYKL